jgi:hypothetical protein
MEDSVRLVRRGRQFSMALFGLVFTATSIWKLLERSPEHGWAAWSSEVCAVILLFVGVKLLVFSVRSGVRADRVGCSYLGEAFSVHGGWGRTTVPWCLVREIEVEKESKRSDRFSPVLVLTDDRRIHLTMLSAEWAGGSGEFDRIGTYRAQLDKLRRAHTPCSRCRKSAAAADRELADLHSRVETLERQLGDHLGA